MNITLNDFLNKLPELLVDGLLFFRSTQKAEGSGYYIKAGLWKLRKTGYKEYDVRVLTDGKYVQVGSWSSAMNAGDIFIEKIAISVSGVIVTLGLDEDY